jgi:hypothetical protein
LRSQMTSDSTNNEISVIPYGSERHDPVAIPSEQRGDSVHH